MTFKQTALVKFAGGTLLLCLLGPFAINLPLLTPITLQSLVVVLVPMITGWRIGVSAILAYLLLGAVGLPVFANFNSGLPVFAGASAGFLFGFPLAGGLAGWWAARVKPHYVSCLTIFIAAHILLLFCGTVGFLVAGLSGQQIASTLTGLLPGLLIKSLVGAGLVLYWKKSPAKNRIEPSD
jgi:biotin transport system substrate-specific component